MPVTDEKIVAQAQVYLATPPTEAEVIGFYGGDGGPAALRIWFATISLVFGLLGAVVGYLLGYFAYELVKPMLAALGWLDKIDAQVAELREITAQSPWKAFWLLVIAGFTPIPLKIFTWASGIVGVPFLPFLASMAITLTLIDLVFRRYRYQERLRSFFNKAFV